MSISNSSGDSDSDTAEQCCGSGCNNCVLDQLITNNPKVIDLNSKSNIFTKNYTKFIVENIYRLTDTVFEFTFKYLNIDGIDLSNYAIIVPPGYHLFLRSRYLFNENSTINQTKKHDQNTIENYISRPYTPIKINQNDLQFKILVKYEANGQMSKYLKKLSIGDCTEWKGIYGSFCWQKPNKFKHLLCIYQGVGVAPIYRIISSIFADSDDETRITVLGCYENIENILMRKDLYEFHQYWNLNSIIYYFAHQKCTCSNRQQNCPCIKKQLWYNENACPYRLDDYHELQSKAFIDIESTYTIICGLKSFTKQMHCLLIEKLNVVTENIFIF